MVMHMHISFDLWVRDEPASQLIWLILYVSLILQ